jgi:hypothetical protein
VLWELAVDTLVAVLDGESFPTFGRKCGGTYADLGGTLKGGGGNAVPLIPTISHTTTPPRGRCSVMAEEGLLSEDAGVVTTPLGLDNTTRARIVTLRASGWCCEGSEICSWEA